MKQIIREKMKKQKKQNEMKTIIREMEKTKRKIGKRQRKGIFGHT